MVDAIGGALGQQIGFNPIDRSVPRFSRRGMFALANTAGGSAIATPFVSDRTWNTKFQVPCATFSAVRVGIRNQQPNLVNCKGLVGSTETADVSTISNQTGCIVNGQRVDTVDSTTDATGWQTLKINGNAAMVLAAGGGGNGSSLNSSKITWTDWVPIQSIARADGGVGSLINVRLFYQGTVTNYGFCSSTASLQSYSSANRGFLAQTAFVDADAVAAPSTAMANTNSFMCPVIIEFMSDDILASVGVIGDSHSDSVGSVADNRSNWLLRACGDISSTSGLGPNSAVLPVNMACSGSVVDFYWGLAQEHMELSTPDILVFQGVSLNGTGVFSPTGAPSLRYKEMALYRQQIHSFLRFCRLNNVVPIIMTGCVNEAYNTVAWDAERRAFQAELNSMGVLVFDSWQMLGNGASPEVYQPAYRLSSNHPNEVGVEAMAQAFKPVLMKALQYRAGML
jgi:hypothetical protein